MRFDSAFTFIYSPRVGTKAAEYPDQVPAEVSTDRITRLIAAQERISQLVFELGICGRYKRFNELNHSHWTVKEIDLMEVLGDAGLNPFAR